MAIITISRGSLSGGARLAELLGTRLGHRVLSREVIVEAAATYGVSEEQLAQGLREPPGLWSRLTHHAGDYGMAVQAALSSMVEAGDAVYHGLAGAFLLAELPGVLKLRLIAPRYQREELAMKALGVGRERASDHLDEVDQQRSRWVRALYGQDWAEPAHYDLIVNLGEMTMETAVALVTTMVRRPEYSGGPEQLQKVRDFALRSRILAHLRLCSPHADVSVDVRVERGSVALSGGRSFEQGRDDILRFVRRIPGAEHARSSEKGAASEPGSGRTVRDLMVPLSRYPHVSPRATLAEAVVALRAGAATAEESGEVAPRYVLVVDEGGALRGLVGRRDLLRGLSPELRSVARAVGTVAAMFPRRADDAGYDAGLDSLFTAAVMDGAREPVGGVMRAIASTVNPSDPLGLTAGRMLQHDIDLVVVVDDAAVLGVVRMTDLFSAVTAQVAHDEAAGA